mgnify:FL=1
MAEQAKEAGKEVSEEVRRGLEMLKRLEEGPWPSHVTELKKSSYPLEAYAQGLARNYTPWLSGSFRVRYVFSGILARRSRDGRFVEIHFRTYVPAGRFYSTSYLRKIVEFVKRYGVGIVEFGGNTGALVINIQADKADEAVDALRTIVGTDVGGSGDTVRELYACPGPALCEFALYDTLHAMDYIRSHPTIYRYLNTQLFPYKVKFKFSGCPFDCAMANSRADFGFIGTWVGPPEVDQGLLRKMIEEGRVNPRELVESCPSKAITWDEERKELKIDGSKCLKAMNCIKKAFPAIRPGKVRKIAIVVGAHAQGHFGPKLGRAVALIDHIEEAIPFINEVINKYMELAPRRNRIGDMIYRRGFKVISEVADRTLPDKPKGMPSDHLRLTIGSVLTEDERRSLEEWAQSLVREYFGGGGK